LVKFLRWCKNYQISRVYIRAGPK